MVTTLNFRIVFVGDDGEAHFRDTIDYLPWGGATMTPSRRRSCSRRGFPSSESSSSSASHTTRSCISDAGCAGGWSGSWQTICRRLPQISQRSSKFGGWTASSFRWCIVRRTESRGGRYPQAPSSLTLRKAIAKRILLTPTASRILVIESVCIQIRPRRVN
ncbi:hypothetical protein DFH08DRAFT_272763 [Mycena albidolilacea]|uniref:Uncharacterized protein n=1 Tax=Mycena albidolilacea TaxID=1033008 RepID=A0AAD7F1M0_9AGAR|nr:hypothetical protein DFH08DRAFT_272763 [Mycena albidolilacea]